MNANQLRCSLMNKIVINVPTKKLNVDIVVGTLVLFKIFFTALFVEFVLAGKKGSVRETVGSYNTLYQSTLFPVQLLATGVLAPSKRKGSLVFLSPDSSPSRCEEATPSMNL